jgi:hypothetical protein
MKRSTVNLILTVSTLFFALPSRAKAVIVTGESIEWVLATSDCVVAGSVVKIERLAGPDQRKYELVTVAVSKTIKGTQTERLAFLSEVQTLGAPPKEYHFGQQWMDEGVPIMFCLVKNDGKRSPFAIEKSAWVLRDAVLLGKTKHKWTWMTGCIHVLTRDFDVLTDKDAILKYAEETVKSTPKDYVPVSHTVTVPTDTAVFRTMWSRSSVRLILPVDRTLETFGQKWCSSVKPGERGQGADILGHFKSDKNIALLKSLLADPVKGETTLYSSSSKNPGGLVYRKNVYYVRQAAFDALSKLGAKVVRPVLEEVLEGRDEPDPFLDLLKQKR